mgnify:CR=1 FL=1
MIIAAIASLTRSFGGRDISYSENAILEETRHRHVNKVEGLLGVRLC